MSLLCTLTRKMPVNMAPALCQDNTSIIAMHTQLNVAFDTHHMSTKNSIIAIDPTHGLQLTGAMFVSRATSILAEKQ